MGVFCNGDNEDTDVNISFCFPWWRKSCPRNSLAAGLGYVVWQTRKGARDTRILVKIPGNAHGYSSSEEVSRQTSADPFPRCSPESYIDYALSFKSYV